MGSLHHLFPVKLSADWQNLPPASLNTYVSNWLLEPSSLTTRLQNHCDKFRVEVLGQEVIDCPEEEACDVIIAGKPVLSREVVLYCDDVPHVFARSLLPISSLTGEQAELAKLGTKPLGQVIFNNPSLKRELIQIGCFSSQTSVGKLCQELQLEQLHDLWGRRSLFYIDDKPLMVAEVFLPQAVAYQQGVFA